MNTAQRTRRLRALQTNVCWMMCSPPQATGPPFCPLLGMDSHIARDNPCEPGQASPGEGGEPVSKERLRLERDCPWSLPLLRDFKWSLWMPCAEAAEGAGSAQNHDYAYVETRITQRIMILRFYAEPAPSGSCAVEPFARRCCRC